MTSTAYAVWLWAAVAARAAPPDVGFPAADRIVRQSSEDLGHGFRRVSVSVRMPPGHFEGIGHFSFVFFGDLALCQCGGVPVAPSGAYALLDSSDGVTLFTTASQRRTTLAEQVPNGSWRATWDEPADTVTLVYDDPSTAAVVLALGTGRTAPVGFVAEGPVTAELVGERGTFPLPGEAPLGTYAVRASWEGGPPMTLKGLTVAVRAGVPVTVTCNRLFQRCSAS